MLERKKEQEPVTAERASYIREAKKEAERESNKI